jgi:hypothetical protein
VDLTFPTVLERVYHVQFSDNLITWTDIPYALNGTGNPYHFQLTIASPDTFYWRVRVDW